MSRCKNVTTLYVDDRAGEVQQIKAVIRCGAEVHDTDVLCSAVLLDSDPRAFIIWSGTTGNGKPISHG